MNFKSKWGYHPCDHETYQKLRELNRFTYEEQTKAFQWLRWARKAPHNRRGSEPELPEKLCKKVTLDGFVRVPRQGGYDYKRIKVPTIRFDQETIDMIRLDKKNAQYPKENEGTVKPLHLSLTKINELIDKIRQ